MSLNINTSTTRNYKPKLYNLFAYFYAKVSAGIDRRHISEQFHTLFQYFAPLPCLHMSYIHVNI